MTYQQRIASICGPGIDPRHVEAYMRAAEGTLDALSFWQFCVAALQAASLVRADRATAERLAQAMGI